MRDAERIPVLLGKLLKLWKRVPDWRFGQFMCNFMNYLYYGNIADPFLIEDKRFFALLEAYVDDVSKNYSDKSDLRYKGDM